MTYDYPRGWVVRCPVCHGSGVSPHSNGVRIVCPNCHGEAVHLSPPQWRDAWEEELKARTSRVSSP